MKPFIAYCTAILIGLSFPTVAASVWQVEHNGNVTFLGGTIHILSPDDYPLPTAFHDAYAKADSVVFETDIAAIQTPQFQQLMMAKMAYQDGRTFKDELHPEIVTALTSHLKRRGIPIENLLSFKPALLSLTLSNIEFQLAGLTSEGVDMYFAAKANKDNKPITWLESPEQQIAFLANLGKGRENELIQYTLDEIDTLKSSVIQLKRFWRTGDMLGLKSSQLDEMQAQFPDIYLDLLVNRNQLWLPQIEQMLKTPETELVLVGALHLAGEHSVLNMLQSQGYRIEKVSD